MLSLSDMNIIKNKNSCGSETSVLETMVDFEIMMSEFKADKF